jgi:hypothetical protein
MTLSISGGGICNTISTIAADRSAAAVRHSRFARGVQQVSARRCAFFHRCFVWVSCDLRLCNLVHIVKSLRDRKRNCPTLWPPDLFGDAVEITISSSVPPNIRRWPAHMQRRPADCSPPTARSDDRRKGPHQCARQEGKGNRIVLRQIKYFGNRQSTDGDAESARDRGIQGQTEGQNRDIVDIKIRRPASTG